MSLNPTRPLLLPCGFGGESDYDFARLVRALLKYYRSADSPGQLRLRAGSSAIATKDSVDALTCVSSPELREAPLPLGVSVTWAPPSVSTDRPGARYTPFVWISD